MSLDNDMRDSCGRNKMGIMLSPDCLRRPSFYECVRAFFHSHATHVRSNLFFVFVPLLYLVVVRMRGNSGLCKEMLPYLRLPCGRSDEFVVFCSTCGFVRDGNPQQQQQQESPGELRHQFAVFFCVDVCLVSSRLLDLLGLPARVVLRSRLHRQTVFLSTRLQRLLSRALATVVGYLSLLTMFLPPTAAVSPPPCHPNHVNDGVICREQSIGGVAEHGLHDGPKMWVVGRQERPQEQQQRTRQGAKAHGRWHADFVSR